MRRITTRVPQELLEALDAAADQLRCDRGEVICQALERYLEDHGDLKVAHERLRDPGDPVLDWDPLRHELLGSD